MPTISADGKYYVDLGHDPVFGTGSFVSVFPESCSFDHMIRGVGNISFQLSFSAKDQDGNPAVTAPTNVGTVGDPSWVPFIGPYRTYWRLRYGDIALGAGVLVNTNSQKGSDYMSIAGKTWEHFHEKWIYPDDARPGHTEDFVFSNSYTGNEGPIGAGHETPTSLVYEAANRDVIRILRDLLSVATTLEWRVPLNYDSLATALAGIQPLYFTYDWGNTSTLDQLVSQLAGYGQGFDWWFSQDTSFKWGSPYRYGTTSAPAVFDTLTDSSPGVDITFNNNGPIATHEIGSGAGLATPTTLRRSFGSGDNESFFSRLDNATDFGDVRDVDALIMKTQKQLSLDVQPQHDIPLTMYPGQYPDGERQYWSDYRVGRAIHITMDFFYHRVDSPFQLVSYQAQLSNEGDATVNWTIQQIYDVSVTAGTPEG